MDSGVEVHARGVEHAYDGSLALRGVDLDVMPAEFMTLLGASGSGKSTLLHAIAGLIEPVRGQIRIGAADVTHVAPEGRNIGFVFQNYALFPHMTVRANVAFPLEMRRYDKKSIRSRVADALDMVGLNELAGRYPGQLSGGQQQRVALARAITFHPRVLLLDEPLGALDRQLRQQLGLDLRRLQREIGITTIYVTHDQEEAFVLSNRIAVMSQGRILQVATPQEMYRRPANLFVANFLGDLNVLEGTVTGSSSDLVHVDVGGAVLSIASKQNRSNKALVSVGIRPEDLHVSAGDSFADTSFPARVEAVIFGGSWVRYELAMNSGARVHAVAASTAVIVEEGASVNVAYQPQSLSIFDRPRHHALAEGSEDPPNDAVAEPRGGAETPHRPEGEPTADVPCEERFAGDVAFGPTPGGRA